MRKKTLARTVLAAIVLLVVGGTCLERYRDMTTGEERIRTRLTRIDRALQIRNELIPHIVDAVKGHAPKEREAFDAVIRARVGMSEARDLDALSDASVAMGNAMTDLLSVVDTCPPLKNDGEFNRLCDELAEAEDRIEAACRDYNERLREYNASLEPFPNNLIAGLFGFVKHESAFATPDETKEVLVLDRGGET